MTLRDEYEYLKSELMVELTDATVMCNLDFPFDFKIPSEEENKYFIRGAQTRLATKKAIIILDNTYKKCRLFPSEETAETFAEIRDDILKDYKTEVIKAYNQESWRFFGLSTETFSEYIDTLIDRIKEASKKYIETIKNLTPDDIAREIKQIDKIRQQENTTYFNIETQNKKGLF